MIKEMPQKLPIALAQVTGDNISSNLLNKIRRTIYSLYRRKKFLKKYAKI